MNETLKTFEAHGQTWQVHTPGDPMPCDENAEVQTLSREEEQGATPPYLPSMKAHLWTWGEREGSSRSEIIGWRYTTPQEPDELATLRAERELMLAAIREAGAVIERALMVHKAITTYSQQSADDLAANIEHCGMMSDVLAKLQPFLPSK